MALNITTPVNTSIGVTIPTSYARVAVTDDINGKLIVTSLSIYSTKASFEGGADPLPVIIGDKFLSSVFSFPYNREIDGADILQLAHTAWIAYLGTLEITAIEDLA